jgi:hypothetical protein
MTARIDARRRPVGPGSNGPSMQRSRIGPHQRVAMVPAAVNHGSEMAMSEHEHLIQTSTPDPATKRSDEGVASGCPARNSDDP